MNIKIDSTNLANHPPATDLFLSPEYRYRAPTASSDGVSFPAVPVVSKVARLIVTTIVTLGTVSFNEAVDLRKYQGLKIVLPDASPTKATITAERYAQLKQQIVAAGIPLLTDEELREEIRGRKGVKSEPED